MATTLFDFNSVTNLSPRFYLTEQMTFVATGLAPTDYIEFEVLTLVTTEPIKTGTANVCNPGKIGDVSQAVTGAAFLTCGNGVNRIRLTAIKPSIVIDSPQESWLRAVYSGTSLGTFTVTAQNSNVTSVTEALRGCESQYCPSVLLPDGGFGYHTSDYRDPAASVEIAPCAPSTEASIWLYPTAQQGATAAAYDCDFNILGYGRNASTCAPIGGVPAFDCGISTVVVPVVPVAPKIVAFVANADDSMTIQLSDGTSFTATMAACPVIGSGLPSPVPTPAPTIVSFVANPNDSLTISLSNGTTFTANLASC